MSTTYTPNIKLGQPALGDTGWSTPLNANCTTLDGLAKLKPDILLLDLRMPDKDGLAVLEEVNFDTIPTRHLLKPALEIGFQHQRSFYDSIYLALALSQQIEFITADERLANAVAAHLPVKWLGTI